MVGGRGEYGVGGGIMMAPPSPRSSPLPLLITRCCCGQGRGGKEHVENTWTLERKKEMGEGRIEKEDGR